MINRLKIKVLTVIHKLRIVFIFETMADIREELAFMISSLNVAKFRELVKSFLKAKYQTEEVFITDGPYDGGLDMEVRLSSRTIKRNIQVTVQKDNIEDKLRIDLQSSRENVHDHKYLDQLDFYYNQKVSRSKDEKWKTMAETEYEINLTIYDCNTLAQLNEEYPIIKAKTLELLEISTGENLLEIDKETKILFDVLSFGKETGEIKKQFINAYIFSFLYSKPGSTIEEIIEHVGQQLDITDVKVYRDNLSAAKGRGELTTDESKKMFSLSDSKLVEIKSIYENNELKESLLADGIKKILEQFGLESCTVEVASFLVAAYRENYTVDLNELVHRSFSIENSIKKIFESLEKLIISKGIDEKNAHQISKDLIDLCGENEYLNKIGASILFANLYKSNKLEEYLNNKIQFYYFDTQVLLRLICIQYLPESGYDDIYYLSVKDLYDTIKNSDQDIELGTSFDYLNEVAGHIQEALKLQRFFSLPRFEKVNTSQNVFYNFYKYALKNDLIEEDMSLESFFADMLGLDAMPDYDNPHFSYIVSGKLKSIYDVLNIYVVYHEQYDNLHVVKKEYEIVLSYQDKFRTPTAVNNDVKMIMFLSDKEKHRDRDMNIRSEPFLVTWDKLFYDVRKSIGNAKYQNYQFDYWYIYSPAKLADRLSIMNFKLNPKSIDHNIISLTETTFNTINKSGTFLDILSTFFDKKNLSEIKLANKLLALEEQLLNEKPEETTISEKPSPLVDILLNVRSHYWNAESFKFDDVIYLFETKEYENQIYSSFEETINNYLEHGSKIKYDSLFQNINELLIKAFSGTADDANPETK